MNRKLISLISLVLIAVLLAACGAPATSSTPATGSSTAPAPAAGSSTAPAAGSSTAPAAAPGKDTVVVGLASEPALLMVPFMATNMDHVPILHNIYEGPIRMGFDGEHIPVLAKSWEVSPDGLRYTFHLRDDVYFHNGDKMTAEDVKFSWDTVGPTGRGQQLMGNFTHAEVIDDNTVVAVLSAPNAAFLNGMAGRFALVVNKKLYEEIGEEKYNAAPVGTGPYKFVDRVPGDRSTLVAFDDYWGEAPAVKNIILRTLTDTNTQMVALESGDIDVLIRANVSMLSKMTSPNVTYATTPASSIGNMGMNLKDGPTQNLAFRRALQYAINREEINIGVFEGMAATGYIPMAPQFTARPLDGTYPVYEYNLEKAKEMLKEAGYKGEELRFVTPSGTANELAAQIIQGQLIEAGINCQLAAMDSASYTAATENNEFHISLRASGVSLVDSDGLYFMHHSTHVTMPPNKDKGNHSPTLDALIEKGRTESDQSKRPAIYSEAVTEIIENVYSIALYYEVNAVGYDKTLNGVKPHALFGLYYFSDWSW